MSQREPIEDLQRLGAPLRRRTLVRVAADENVLEDRERREEREVLERARDAGPGDAVRRKRKQVVPVERDATGPRLVEPADAVEEGRLARAVRSDERTDLAELDREREVGQRDDAAELGSQLLDR